MVSVRLIDISVPVHPQMPVFPGDPGVVFAPVMDMHCGAVANVTLLHLGSQTGTHIDTPHHILNNGVTVEQLGLEAFYGPADVVVLPSECHEITAQVIQAHWQGQSPRVLFKTKNSAFWQQSPTQFREDFAALTADGAEYLVSKGVCLVGVDYLSVELFGASDLGAHHALLNANVVILEGLNLSQAMPKTYTLSAFPICYQGLDGAPVRAVLIEA